MRQEKSNGIGPPSQSVVKMNGKPERVSVTKMIPAQKIIEWHFICQHSRRTPAYKFGPVDPTPTRTPQYVSERNSLCSNTVPYLHCETDLPFSIAQDVLYVLSLSFPLLLFVTRMHTEKLAHSQNRFSQEIIRRQQSKHVSAKTTNRCSSTKKTPTISQLANADDPTKHKK